MVREAFFLAGAEGGRFCLVTHPAGPSIGGLLYVPPFAEELNKTRRMAALAASAFAARGWTVCQLDLFGTGDSAGDFGDTTWAHWLADIDLAWAWMQENVPGPAALWSLRGGALLVSDWASGRGVDCPWLMWQPVTAGRQHLAQFLRLKSAAAMLNAADAQRTTQELRKTLAAGATVEVAGYTLNPALVQGMEAAQLRLSAGRRSPLSVLEVTSQERSSLSPALTRFCSQLEADEVTCTTGVVAGPAFWQTVEVEVAPELVVASQTVLEGWAA